MKKSVTYLILILMLFAPACSNNSIDDTRTKYRSIDNTENHKQVIDDRENQDNKDIKNENNNNKNNKTTTDTKNEPNKTMIVNKEPNVIVENIPSFTGIVSDYNSPECGNLTINSKLNSSLSLVCQDPDNDIIYYVNYGKDNYIYQLKDGISTLLVEKPTYYIQFWKDEIYFFGYNDQYPIFFENIYKYNISTQELDIVIETMSDWMSINSNGIYFTNYEKLSDDTLVKVYLYSFESKSVEFYSNDVFMQYKDYILEFHPTNNGISLQLKKYGTNEIYLDIADASYREKTCIYNDYLFYINDNLNIIDLKEGKKYIINLGYDTFNKPYIIADYILIDDNINISVGKDCIFKFNIHDLSITKIRYADKKIYNNLFTCDNRIYATNLRYELLELIINNATIETKELSE